MESKKGKEKTEQSNIWRDLDWEFFKTNKGGTGEELNVVYIETFLEEFCVKESKEMS